MPTYIIRIYLLIIHVLLKINFITTQCSGTPKTIQVGYQASSFQFPESGEYGTSLQCEWLLTSSVSGTILYKSTGIDIDCSDSYNIYDGSSVSSPAKETGICTTGSPISKPLDRSSGHDLLLRFISDGTATLGKDNGFRIYFVSSPDLSSCPVSGTSNNLTASSTSQAFTSPSFPNTYQINYQCTWTISPSQPGRTVTLSLYYIDIDSNGGTCYDKLTINYGQTVEVCGDENFSPTNTYTNVGGGDITVTFTSDNIQVESGFLAVYKETDSSAPGSDDDDDDGDDIVIIVVPIVVTCFVVVVIVLWICGYLFNTEICCAYIHTCTCTNRVGITAGNSMEDQPHASRDNDTQTISMLTNSSTVPNGQGPVAHANRHEPR